MKSEGLTPAQLAERNAEYVTEISRLEKERAALAAENATLKAICEDRRTFIMNGVLLGFIQMPTAEIDPALKQFVSPYHHKILPLRPTLSWMK